MFLASLLTLASLSVSYSGFSDILTVYSTVTTGIVTLEIVEYSGTWVYKDFDTGGVYITHDPYDPGPVNGELVAYSYAMPDPEGITDVLMVWDNILPCINFTADIKILYTGSVPGHITIGDLIWYGYDFSEYLEFIAYDQDGNVITQWPLQMHFCDKFTIAASIYLDQENGLQGQSGSFGFDTNAIQWYDPCAP